MSKAIFQLEPLTCPSCVKKIEAALQKQSGVKQAKVLFNAGKVKTEFDGEVVEAEKLKNTIETLGYPVLNMKLS